MNVPGPAAPPRKKCIGIVSGVGPFAGLDLLGKILEQTRAATDAEHLNILSISRPEEIADRTRFLRTGQGPNPGCAIARQLLLLETIGAEIAAVPCSTAHADEILGVTLAQLRAAHSRLRFVNMIEETGAFLRQRHPAVRRVGLLCTTGTRNGQLYPRTLKPLGLEVLTPDDATQEGVHAAIYDERTGLKGVGRLTKEARRNLSAAVTQLREQGADAILLGCTELPLAVRGGSKDGDDWLKNLPAIDPTLILARALIREASRDL